MDTLILTEIHGYSDFLGFNIFLCSGIPCYIHADKQGVVTSQSPPGCGSFSDLFLIILTFSFFVFKSFLALLLFFVIFMTGILKNTGQVCIL